MGDLDYRDSQFKAAIAGELSLHPGVILIGTGKSDVSSTLIRELIAKGGRVDLSYVSPLEIACEDEA